MLPTMMARAAAPSTNAADVQGRTVSRFCVANAHATSVPPARQSICTPSQPSTRKGLANLGAASLSPRPGPIMLSSAIRILPPLSIHTTAGQTR
jgi:hypothetical protein